MARTLNKIAVAYREALQIACRAKTNVENYEQGLSKAQDDLRNAENRVRNLGNELLELAKGKKL